MLKIFKLKKGFTLIELLVVISVIAVLAVALLSSINPIEQVNKARDTASKSDASELLGALERYYSTFGCYPWNYDNAVGTDKCKDQASQAVLPVVAVNNATFKSSVLDVLASKAEVKAEFVTRLSASTNSSTNLLHIVSASAAAGEPELVHISFIPSSKTFKAKGKGVQACTAFTGGTYYCTPGSD